VSGFADSFAALNAWAILAAAIAGFVVGGLWYSPALFQRAWVSAAGVDEARLAAGGAGKVFGVSFLLLLLAAFVLAMFLGPQADFAFGVVAGLLVAVGWVATSLGVLYLFERRPLAHFWINAGYLTVTFAAMGAILGAWR
jgi:Protein of unknown function (DUF1761)